MPARYLFYVFLFFVVLFKNPFSVCIFKFNVNKYSLIFDINFPSTEFSDLIAYDVLASYKKNTKITDVQTTHCGPSSANPTAARRPGTSAAHVRNGLCTYTTVRVKIKYIPYTNEHNIFRNIFRMVSNIRHRSITWDRRPHAR